MRVPILRPYLDDKEANAVKEVLESGWMIMGRKVAELENRVAKLVGVDYAKACSSCTTALHMAVLALGIGPGDKVLVPAYTFVATANAVEYTGATPIFVDVDPRTFNIDPKDFIRKYEKSYKVDSSGGCISPRAVIPVHLFGLCADMADILEIEGISVIEDAACAMGSCGPEGMAGAMGALSCFSFHPRKSIATGEGGMVTTNDRNLAETVHQLRDFGFTGTNFERHEKGVTLMPEVNLLGYNYRMSDIHGAIGVEQMKKWDEIVGKKIDKAKIYGKELGGIEWLSLPYVPEGYYHTYQSYACRVLPPADRGKVMNQLKEAGVATREGTHAVPLLGYYAKKYGYKTGDFPGMDACDRECITIPMFPSMTEEEQSYVIEAIKKVNI